jgi:septal ring factor EnvC (AmiA/AmiB activator)
VSRARATLVAKLKASAQELVALEAQQRDKQAALAANEEEQRVAKKQLEAERVARQKTVDRIKADINRGRREIGRLKRDEDRLAKLVDQLVRALAKARSERKAEPPRKPGDGRGQAASPGKGEVIDRVADATLSGRAFESLRGKLRLPVRGELQGRFGSPREEGGVTWKGVFIKAESGTPVRAVADGQVVYADWLRGFGNLLVVDHGNGYLSIYGNNESLLKQVGEMATGGEAIASAGSSGGALESGVYFELRHEGKPFDPMKWVGR